MKIAACIMVNDQSFSFSISEGNTISIGAHASADVVISQFNKVIDIHLDKGTVKLCTKQGSSMNVSTAGFDQFVILDQDFRIAAYFTEEVIEEKTFRLPFEGEVSVGRSGKASSKGDTNDIIINLPYISSFHFKIICKKNQTLVCDCDSKNGLYLNGSLVRKAVLHDGDIISVFTARIIFKDNTLFFENVGSHIQMKRLPAQKCYEEAPKNPVTNRDFYCSRSPRLVSTVNKEVINLEKPPHVEAAPQINWINVLLTPAISIGLMLVLVVAMGMNAVMLIMSGGMSLVSAVVAYVNYNKQKAQHNNKDALINTKYRAYLADVSSRLEQGRTHQLSSLTSANPAPADCLKIAKDRKPQLWERSLSDEDALCVRIGTGTIHNGITTTTPSHRAGSYQILVGRNSHRSDFICKGSHGANSQYSACIFETQGLNRATITHHREGVLGNISLFVALRRRNGYGISTSRISRAREWIHRKKLGTGQFFACCKIQTCIGAATFFNIIRH